MPSSQPDVRRQSIDETLVVDHGDDGGNNNHNDDDSNDNDGNNNRYELLADNNNNDDDDDDDDNTTNNSFVKALPPRQPTPPQARDWASGRPVRDFSSRGDNQRNTSATSDGSAAATLASTAAYQSDRSDDGANTALPASQPANRRQSFKPFGWA